MPKCSVVTQSIPVILVGAPRRILFSSEHMQSSVKLCFPYILNTICQSSALQTVRKKPVAHMHFGAAVLITVTSP